MNQKKSKILLVIFLIPILVYFWPVQMYGDTGYIMLLGNSMYPTIESGTFVITKPEQNYLLGDVIAFVNEDNLNVVHRIVEITEEGYITKGDNNRKNDPVVVPIENVIGRTIFIIPYMGFTSLFLQTPIGMSIFVIWALVMFSKRKPEKSKVKVKESFLIFKLAFVSIISNYVLTQSALAINHNASKIMTIPFEGYFDPSIANTLSFALYTIGIFVLYFLIKGIKLKKKSDEKPMKLIFTLGAIMIFAINLIGTINIVPFFMNLINEQSEIIPIF